MHAQANSHFHDRRRALLPCRSFEPPCPTLEALFEEASILAGSDVFIHGLVAALGTGTKRNTQSCLAQTDRALAGKSRRQEKYHRYRRWLLARCSSQASVPELFREPTVATLHAGTSKLAFTNTRSATQTSSPCSNNLKAN